MNPNDYSISTSTLDWPRVYAEWRWLVPPDCRPIFVSCFGDVFVALPDDSVSLLDLEYGSLEHYTESVANWEARLVNDPEINELLYIPLVDELAGNGVHLREFECYHFKQPTVLGGEFDVANVAKTDLNERVSFCGNIQKQIADLPDGAQIEIDWSD